jgi:hypothetical protein
MGISVLALGVYGDSQAWWDSYPFVTNVLSSTCGVFFGIPFAVLVLQRLIAGQESASQAETINRMYVASAAELVAAVDMFTPGSDRVLKKEVLGILLGALQRYDDLLVLIAERMRQSSGGIVGEERYPGQSNDVQKLKGRAMEVQGALDAHLSSRGALDAHLSSRGECYQAWRASQAVWSFLDTYIRPRIIEAGGRWLDPQEGVALRALLSSSTTLFNVGFITAMRDGQEMNKIADELGEAGLVHRIAIYGPSEGDRQDAKIREVVELKRLVELIDAL